LNFKCALVYKINPKAALIINLIKCIDYYLKDFIKFKKDKCYKHNKTIRTIGLGSIITANRIQGIYKLISLYIKVTGLGII
jgi:hypothetical protein